MTSLIINYSNPRAEAVFTDWPLGGNRRGECRFFVEKHPKRGYRVGRVTTGKPKFTTYHGPCAVVDGSDGRTYVLQFASLGFVYIWASDLATNRSVHESSDPEQYTELLNIIKSCPKPGNTPVQIESAK